MNEKRLEEIEARIDRVMGLTIPGEELPPDIVDFISNTPHDVYDLVDEVRRLREREWKLRDAPPPSRSNIISKG